MSIGFADIREPKPTVTRAWLNSWIGYWHGVHGVDVKRATKAMEAIMDEAGVVVPISDRGNK